MDLDEASRLCVLTEEQLLSRHLEDGGGGAQAEKEQSVTSARDAREGHMLPHPTSPSCER